MPILNLYIQEISTHQTSSAQTLPGVCTLKTTSGNLVDEYAHSWTKPVNSEAANVDFRAFGGFQGAAQNSFFRTAWFFYSSCKLR
jgi:hypothetical protein